MLSRGTATGPARCDPPDGMATEEQDDPVRRERAVLRFGILALLLVSPLPFGSVEPWAVLAIEISAACLGAGALYVFSRNPASLSRGARALLIPASVLVLIGLLQLVPAPAEWIRLLWPATVEAREAVGRLVPEAAARLAPGSLSPADTLDALLRMVAYILVGLAAAIAIRTPRHARQAAAVIAVSGLFQALYGSAEYLSGHQHIFGYAKKHYLDGATGTFINRNHFAGYLAMTLPLTLGLLNLRAGPVPGSSNWRQRVIGWMAPKRALPLFAAFAAVATWAGVILSYSRTGLAVALVASSLAVLLGGPRRRGLLILLVVLAVPTLLLMCLDIKAPAERFSVLGEDVLSPSGRLAVWRGALGIVGRYPVLGSGLGTFESAFRMCQTAPITGRFDHAHNDWLEALAEAGPIGLGALLAGLLLTARSALRGGRRGLAAGFQVYPAAAMAAVALHSVTDFCLRIPAIAILLATVLALAVRGEQAPLGRRFRIDNRAASP